MSLLLLFGGGGGGATEITQTLSFSSPGGMLTVTPADPQSQTLAFTSPGGQLAIQLTASHLTDQTTPIPWRLIVVDQDCARYAETIVADIDAELALNDIGALSFTIPIDDPIAPHCTILDRYVQLWHGPLFIETWQIIRTRQTRDNDTGARLACECKTLEYLLTRRPIGPAGRSRWSSRETGANANQFFNPSFEQGQNWWSFEADGASIAFPSEHPYDGERVARIDQTTANKNTWLRQDFTFASGYPEGSQVSFSARVWVNSTGYVGTAINGRLAYIEAYDVSLGEVIDKLEITWQDDYPFDAWFQISGSLHAINGRSITFRCHFYGQGGATFFDDMVAIFDDRLAYQDDDPVTIVYDLVAKSQDAGLGMRDANIDAPATTVLAGNVRDATIWYRDHTTYWEAIRRFDELDVAITTSPTERLFRTWYPQRGTDRRLACVAELGRNITTYDWASDGENAADVVVTLGEGSGDLREEGVAVANGAATPSASTEFDTSWYQILDTPAVTTGKLSEFAALNLPAMTDPVTVEVTIADLDDWFDFLRPGDTIWYRIHEGAVSIDAAYRVSKLHARPLEQTLTITADPAGLNARPQVAKYLADLDRRVGRIERSTQPERKRPDAPEVIFSWGTLVTRETGPWTFRRRTRINRWTAELNVAGSTSTTVIVANASGTIATMTIPASEYGIGVSAPGVYLPDDQVTATVTTAGTDATDLVVKGWE